MSRNSSIALAAVCDQLVVIRGPDCGLWPFHSFSIAPDLPSFYRLPDSAFSSPGRYVQEIFLRVVESASPGLQGGCFLFNPYFTLTYSNVLIAIATLRKLDFHSLLPAILVDCEGIPLGYFLPGDFNTKDSRYLGFLSTTDASVDAELLKLICFSDVELHTLSHLRLVKTARNGFDGHGLPHVYRWITQQAIRLLATNIQPSKSATRAARLNIPVTAFMPHHAGDVLFFCLASNHTNADCHRIAVNRAYLDIVRTIAPHLTPVVLDTQPLNRGSAFAAGKATRDDDFFHMVMDTLPTDSFYIYCRPSRNYNVTEFHLLDHFGFALGYSPRTKSKLLFFDRPPPTQSKSISPIRKTYRVLLHFDGGWPLKVYPMNKQSELIALLLARGHEITVLASPGYSHSGVKAVTFSSLQGFIDLSREHDVLIGMDSFPSHYCAHVLGLPTICLFANTKPVNSNAILSTRYTFMENALSCRPCYAIAQCPVYGGMACRNFSEPASVVAQLANLLAGKLQEPPNLNQVERFCTPLPSPRMMIDIRLIELQLRIARFIPETSYLRLMMKEFKHAIQREGVRGAFVRTKRFLMRRCFSRW